MKVVHVEWVDSESSMGWESLAEIESTPLIAHSVGFLLKECMDFVMLAHSYDFENEHYNGAIRIPKCSILKMSTLCGIKDW